MPIKLIAVFLLAASTLTVNVAAAASIVDVERTRAGWWTDKFLAVIKGLWLIRCPQPSRGGGRRPRDLYQPEKTRALVRRNARL
jgi:hypothetical protein